MTRPGTDPRPRCPACDGRRVVTVDHIDFIELKPCPYCNGRDPIGDKARHYTFTDARRAA